MGLQSENLGFFNFETSNEIKKDCVWLKDIPNCNSVKSKTIRSLDGACNNLKEPNFGRAFTPFQRILDSEYGPGSNSQPRIAKDGTVLPSARLVSNTGISRMFTLSDTLGHLTPNSLRSDLSNTVKPCK